MYASADTHKQPTIFFIGLNLSVSV